jgi:glycosyltransferase involved in cell wall biosynthesis
MLLEKFKSRIKITVRAFVPPHIERQFKSKFGDGIEFVRTPLPRKKIIEAYQKSDILLLPCHSTPTMAFIEAMSCGLSIVTTNVWANKELLEDAKFAIIVDPPTHVKYEDEFGTPMWYRSEFMRKIERIDSKFIHALFDSVSYLIENENLLIKFKKEALYYFKERFSVEKRNAQLEEVLRSWS